MLNAIIGVQNSGKTADMVLKLYFDYLKGKTIITNFNVNFPHVRINRDFLIELALKGEQKGIILEDVSFGIDEYWIWFDSRRAMSYENMISSYFLLQSSKTDTNIYMTAQRPNQLPYRVKENLHIYSDCSRVLKINNKYYKIDNNHRFLKKFKNINPLNYLYIEVWDFYRSTKGMNEVFKKRKHPRYVPMKIIYKLYQTKQKIIQKNFK